MKDAFVSTQRMILLQEIIDLLGTLGREDTINQEQVSDICAKLLGLKQDIAADHDIDYRGMVESASDTIAVFDLEGIFVYVSPNWSVLLGHDYRKLLGTSIFEGRFHPEDNPRCLAAFREVLDSSRRYYGIEYRIFNVQGEWKWHVANLSPILDEHGKIKAVLAVARDNHAQKMRELEIRDHEARFRLLLNTMQESVLYVDNDDNIQYVNKSCCELYGYTPEELLGKKGYEMLIYKDDWQIILDKNIARQTGLKDQYEVRGVTKAGDLMWLKVSGAPLRDEKGEVIGSVGVLTDITESVRIREALNESERRYHSLFENAVAGVFQSTLDDRYTMVNPAYAKMLGYNDPEDLISTVRDIKDLYLDREQRDELKNKLLQEGFVRNFEAALFTKTGDVVWVLINARLETNYNGEIRIEATGIDITNRKKADLERQKLYSIIDTNVSEIYILDPYSLNILYANRGAQTNTGYSRAEILQMMPMDICPELSEKQIRAILEPMLRGEKTSHVMESKHRRKDGSFYPVEISLQYQEYPQEKIMVVMINDITESKSLQNQLIASQKMEAVGQLAGGVAHDFNNLLTVILGYGEELMNNLQPYDPQLSSVEEIVKAGKRAAQLTQQLLAFSRKQVVQPKNLDLNKLIANMENMFIRILGENISFESRLSDRLNLVRVDPGQMEQVLMNIVVNSRDAMPLGGTIKLTTGNITIDEGYSDNHSEVTPGNYVVLSISDNGCGMDKETQAKVYEPFFTTKGVGRGSGLGLSIVYGIIKQSNGHVLLYSEVGEGTTFKILLPVAEGELDQDQSEKQVTISQGRGETILVVEDEEALRRFVSRMISGLGYKVSSCSSGMEALENIRHGLRPDLIITDIVMPGVNGRELADLVKELVPEQKVLFVSGFNDDVLASHGFVQEGLTYIQKPFSRKELAGKISELLEQNEERKERANFHILMLDDDEGIRNLYKRSLVKKFYSYESAATLEEALEVLNNRQVDLLLLDMNLGVMSGEEALKKIRQDGHMVPVVLLSGLIDPNRMTNLRSLGVVQFFEKGFTNQALYEFIRVMASSR